MLVTDSAIHHFTNRILTERQAITLYHRTHKNQLFSLSIWKELKTIQYNTIQYNVINTNIQTI